MIGLITLGIIAALTAGAIAIFWKEIVNWLGKAQQKIKEALKTALIGSLVFLEKLKNGNFREISEHYTKGLDGTFVKNITIKTEEVSVSDIPEDILKKVNMTASTKVDITDETETKIAELKRA